MSHHWEDWIFETGSSVSLLEYKNERIIELAYKFNLNDTFTKDQFKIIITQIDNSKTLEELKVIDF